MKIQFFKINLLSLLGGLLLISSGCASAPQLKVQEYKALEEPQDTVDRLILLVKYGKEHAVYEPCREDAILALGLIGDKRAVPTLLEIAKYGGSNSLRSASIRALGWIGDPQAIPVLIQRLQHDDGDHVRGVAALALGEMKADEAVPALEKALKDQYRFVRTYAAESLEKITKKKYDYEGKEPWEDIDTFKLNLEELLRKTTRKEEKKGEKREEPPRLYQTGWNLPMEFVVDLAFSKKDRLFVLVGEYEKIMEVSPEAEIIGEISFDLSPHRVQRGSSIPLAVFSDGTFLVGNTRLNQQGQKMFTYPFNFSGEVFIDQDDSIYSLTWKGLGKYRKNGELVFSTGSKGGQDRFQSPNSICVYQDRIFIGDKNRIQIFDTEGNYIKTVGRHGKEKGEFEDTWDIAVDGQGLLYVNDCNNDRIQIFDSQLNYLMELPGYMYSSQFAISPEGEIYVRSYRPAGITKLVPVKGGALSLVGKTTVPIPTEATTTDVNAESFEIKEKEQEIKEGLKFLTSTKKITALAYGSENEIWIATEGGLINYNTQSGDYQKITVADGLPGNKIAALCYDPDNKALWVSGEMTMGCYSPETESWKELTFSPGDFLDCKDIVKDPVDPQIIWILTQKGLIKYNVFSETAQRLNSFEVPSHSIPSPPKNMVFTPKGKVIIQDAKIIFKLDLDKMEAEILLDSDRASRMLGEIKGSFGLQFADLELYRDDLWVVARRDGIFKLNLDSDELSHTSVSFTQGRFPAYRFITLVDDRLWSNCGNHLLAWSDEDQAWELVFSFPEELNIETLMADRTKPEILWIGTDKGFYRYDLSLNQAQPLFDYRNEPPGNMVTDIRFVDGKLWLGIGNEPLTIFDPQTAEWTIFTQFKNAHLLRIDPLDSNYLCLSSQGLNKVLISDPGTESLKIKFSPPFHFISDLAYDGEDWWYVGYREICRRGEEGETRYSVKTGLPFGRTFAVAVDSFHTGWLWFATDKGVFRYDKSENLWEAIKAGVNCYHIVKGESPYLWFTGHCILRYNMETGRWRDYQKRVRARDSFCLDPAGKSFWFAPERKGIREIDIETGVTLQDIPVSVGQMNKLARSERYLRKIWITTYRGLAELSLPSPN